MNHLGSRILRTSAEYIAFIVIKMQPSCVIIKNSEGHRSNCNEVLAEKSHSLCQETYTRILAQQVFEKS
jgi:hypothetical protein